jgi:hypothetical protein
MHCPKRVDRTHKDTNLFDYDALPACARSCTILQVSQLNCIPPAAPTSNLLTYRNCICQSEYLRSLHDSGVICHEACSDVDDEIIHSYYNTLYEHPGPARTNLSISVATKTLVALTTTIVSTLVESSTVSASLRTETGQHSAKGEHTWYVRLLYPSEILLMVARLHRNGKYLATAVGVTIIVVAALLVAYYRHRKNYESHVKSDPICNHSITLKTLTSPSAQPPRPDPRQDWLLKTRADTESSSPPIATSSVSSPLAPYIPVFRLGGTVRMYAEPNSGQDASGRGNIEGPATPMRSLSKTERIIRERIRTTGRPNIPISATPKVTR